MRAVKRGNHSISLLRKELENVLDAITDTGKHIEMHESLVKDNLKKLEQLSKSKKELEEALSSLQGVLFETD